MRLLPIALLLFGASLASQSATACQCADPPPVPDAYREAAVVALVRVTRIEDNWTLWRKVKDWFGGGPDYDPDNWYGAHGFTVTAKVLQQWKGHPTPTLVLVTGRAGGDCGIPFKVGVSYLLYPYRQPDGLLAVSICGRGSFAQDAGPDVQALDALTHAVRP